MNTIIICRKSDCLAHVSWVKGCILLFFPVVYLISQTYINNWEQGSADCSLQTRSSPVCFGVARELRMVCIFFNGGDLFF